MSWADCWQLELSPTKCSVMRLNPKQTATVAPTHTIRGYFLQVTVQRSDLGVSYDKHINYTSHVCRIVKKAAGRAKCILRCFIACDSLLLTRAFCAVVRPLQEESSIIWSPYYKNEINKIEAVQRFFHKCYW